MVLTFHLHDVHEIQQPPPFFFTPMWQYGELYTRGMLIEYNLVIISNNINPVVIFKPFFFDINVQCSNSNFDYYVCW